MLLAIGLLDLIATVYLHAQGSIDELNPLMAPLLAGNGWRFVAVKAVTLVTAWVLLARESRNAPKQVRRACLMGSAAYLALLTAAFVGV